jgi:hypothetical protein
VRIAAAASSVTMNMGGALSRRAVVDKRGLGRPILSVISRLDVLRAFPLALVLCSVKMRLA